MNTELSMNHRVVEHGALRRVAPRAAGSWRQCMRKGNPMNSRVNRKYRK